MSTVIYSDGKKSVMNRCSAHPNREVNRSSAFLTKYYWHGRNNQIINYQVERNGQTHSSTARTGVYETEA